MMVKSGVYCIKNTVNGKVYVGSAVNLRTRELDHRYALIRGDHFNRHLQSAWRKDGASAFRFEVLELVPDKSNLTTVEQRFMDALRAHSMEFGYNLRPKAASNLGVKMPAEAIEKMRLTKIGRKQSPETIAKRLASAIASGGFERARLAKIGHKQTPEQIAKRVATGRVNGGIERTRLSNMGRKRSAESIVRQSNAQRGSKRTLVQRQNISKSLIGKTSAFTREQVAQITSDRDGGMTLQQIADKHGCSRSTACLVVNRVGAFYAQCA